jgi:hypothetical protein
MTVISKLRLYGLHKVVVPLLVDLYQFNLSEAIYNEGIGMCTTGPARMAPLWITLRNFLETRFATDHSLHIATPLTAEIG